MDCAPLAAATLGAVVDMVGIEPTSRGGVSPAFHNATYPYMPSETMTMSLTLSLQTQQAAVLICGFHATSKTTNPWRPVEASADSVHGASP